MTPLFAGTGFLTGVVALGAALFLAACGFALYAVVAGVRSFRQARVDREQQARWTGAVLRVLSREEPPSSVLRLVREEDSLSFTHLLLQFARRLRGPERLTLASLAAPFLDKVAQDTLLPDPEKRARAVYTLGLLGPQRYKEDVLVALDDPAPAVVATATFAVLSLRSVENARAVLSKLHRFEGWDAGFLAFLLGQVGAGLAEDLRGILEDRGQPVHARRIAAFTLVHLQDPLSGDCAERVLRAETDPDILSAVLNLLKNFGRPAHADAVRAACAAPSYFVRAAALSALGRVGGPSDEAFLRDFFDTPNAWVAVHAAEALKAIGATTFLGAIAGSTHPRAALAQQVMEAL